MESLHLILLKLLLCHDTSYILCHVTSKSIYVFLNFWLFHDSIPQFTKPIFTISLPFFFFFLTILFSHSFTPYRYTCSNHFSSILVSLPLHLVQLFFFSYFDSFSPLYFQTLSWLYSFPSSSIFFFILICSYCLYYSLSHSFHVMLTKK